MPKDLTSENLAAGTAIQEPVGYGSGYWAGAPGVYYSEKEGAYYMTYRIRRPRGVDPDRGGEARIARSIDLKHWEDVWRVNKDQFNSASIERCAIRQSSDGVWRYFASYVDPADGRWCVSVLEAREIRGLDPAQARPLFKAKPFGLEGIKDPWIFQERGVFYMLLSVALPAASTTAQSHSTLDIFNTGECVSATGLATSRNLIEWDWQGVIFAPGTAGWDRYCRRINSILNLRGRYFAFYDGSASHLENYEEKTGVAVSSDLRRWHSLTPAGALFTSPHASKSLRYMDAQMRDEDILLFYEFAREDGSHDLRALRTHGSSLTFLDGLMTADRLA